MKKFKKLIPAVCMLLLATMLMGTTTYAWFSMNRVVTATGMEVKATTSSDLYIYNGTVDSSGSNPTWATAPDVDTIASAAQSNIDNLAVYANTPATLTPASTSDFATFFYLANASEIPAGGGIYSTGPASGKISSVTLSHSNLDAAKDYVQVSRCYIAAKEAAAKVYTSLDCTVTIAATTANDDMINTIRVAVIITGTNGSFATKVWSADGNDATVPLASATTLAGAAQTCEASGAEATVITNPRSNEVYTVTTLVWVEGQDTECLNNNALNSDNYAVTLRFELKGTGTTPTP